MSEQPTQIKLSKASPTVPLPKGEEISQKDIKYGISEPASAATTISVYNKKLTNLFRGRLLVLHGDFTVSESLRRMAKFNVSSVPVTKGRKDSTIIGFVDTLDFLALLCRLLSEDQPSGEKKLNLDRENLRLKTETFKNTPISTIAGTSKRNPFCTIHAESSLSDAVEQYLKGVHRVAILDDENDLIGVISQWTIANYLATVTIDEKDQIPILKKPLSEINYTRDVCSIGLNEVTLNGFYRMYQSNLAALAVVDESGKLVGNLSASDLKGFQLYLSDFGDLLRPVSEFLGLVRKKQGRSERFAVSATIDTPLLDAVKKMNREYIHRTYLVDKDSKLIGVFSLTDLMQSLIMETNILPSLSKTKTSD